MSDPVLLTPGPTRVVTDRLGRTWNSTGHNAGHGGTFYGLLRQVIIQSHCPDSSSIISVHGNFRSHVNCKGLPLNTGQMGWSGSGLLPRLGTCLSKLGMVRRIREWSLV